MVIKVARDEGNVDIAALADGLAVVHRLENSETAGMFLDLTGESIEVASAFVTGERLPRRQSFARGGDRSFDVGGVALGNFSEGFAGRGIAGGLIFAACGRNPSAADEFLKAAVMAIEPLVGFFGILRRGAVLHGVELFRNAHSVSL